MLQAGLIAEQQAQSYLVNKGLRWISSNYRCRWGEIDLIMSDAKNLVFVEVRQRISEDYGGALESITRRKQNKIMKTATHYMIKNNLYNSCCARFDVVCIQGPTAQIEWIPDAFRPDF